MLDYEARDEPSANSKKNNKVMGDGFLYVSHTVIQWLKEQFSHPEEHHLLFDFLHVPEISKNYNSNAII